MVTRRVKILVRQNENYSTSMDSQCVVCWRRAGLWSAAGAAIELGVWTDAWRDLAGLCFRVIERSDCDLVDPAQHPGLQHQAVRRPYWQSDGSGHDRCGRNFL